MPGDSIRNGWELEGGGAGVSVLGGLSSGRAVRLPLGALGTFERNMAGGGVRLALRCSDLTGHVMAEVRVRSPGRARNVEETAQFSFRVEPASIDEFVDALSHIDVAVGASLELPDAR